MRKKKSFGLDDEQANCLTRKRRVGRAKQRHRLSFVNLRRCRCQSQMEEGLQRVERTISGPVKPVPFQISPQERRKSGGSCRRPHRIATRFVCIEYFLSWFTIVKDVEMNLNFYICLSVCLWLCEYFVARAFEPRT